MTTFILHGGFTRIDNDSNAAYYHEITKDLATGAVVLVVLFAREEKEYGDALELETKKILSGAGDKQLNIQMASEYTLIEQIEGADAIIIRGGDTLKLTKALKQHPSFADSIKGKVVAGSSAGAYVLSTYYYSRDSGEIHKGLGILPLRVICHFESDESDVTKKAIEDMDNYPKDLELIVLKDCEWKVFTW